MLLNQAAFAAPPTGSLGSFTSITPNPGSDVDTPTLVTSGPCPNTADSYQVVVTGPSGFNFNIVTSTTAGLSFTGSITTRFGRDMRDAAAAQGKSLVAGEYDIDLQCVASFAGTNFGDYTGALIFSDPTHYTVFGGNPSPSPTPSPTPSPSMSPTPSPSMSPTPSPSMSPTPSPSPSPNPTPTPTPGAVMTTTRLFEVPPTVREGNFVILFAVVAPTGATGTVQFMDGDNALGNPQPTLGPIAFLITNQLPKGHHVLTAVFTPTDPTAFQPSTSNKVQVNVIGRGNNVNWIWNWIWNDNGNE